MRNQQRYRPTAEERDAFFLRHRKALIAVPYLWVFEWAVWCSLQYREQDYFWLSLNYLLMIVGFISMKIVLHPYLVRAKQLRNRQEQANKSAATPPSPVKSADGETTGEDEEKRALEQMLADGRAYIAQMHHANIAIEDPKVSDQIYRLEHTAGKIFDYVAAHPHKAPQIRRFMNYYLPTLLKLLRSYDTLEDQGIRGDHISDAMERIERLLETITLSFEKQLDQLFQDEAMDISTDIKVMESMLAMEGLAGDSFKPRASDEKP